MIRTILIEDKQQGRKTMDMDRTIFKLGASVEATSLYILLCALTEESDLLTLERARRQWNGTSEDLLKGAVELMERGVLAGTQPLTQSQPLHLTSSDQWR